MVEVAFIKYSLINMHICAQRGIFAFTCSMYKPEGDPNIAYLQVRKRLPQVLT